MRFGRVRGRVPGAVRLAAGVGVFSITIGAVGLATSAIPTTGAAQDHGLGQLFDLAAAHAGTQATGDALKVTVGKAVAITTDAAGRSESQGLYAATNASGTGTSTVKVPVGTTHPVDVNNFKSLQLQGDSIVYDINNSGSTVDQYVASGGQFAGQLPVTFSVDLKVNGKSVDPNTATSITGDVELNYDFVNHTNVVQPITFKGSGGGIRTKQANIAVPFTINYDATFGNGWAQISAPWANSGFSTGEIVTGSTTLLPNPLNKMSPNGRLTIKAVAQNAKLPAANIVIVPKSTSGAVTSALGTASSAGLKAQELLANKALPLLLEVQGGMGAAAGKISTLLDQKVDPILNLLSRLHLDPGKANQLIQKGGQDLATLADLFIGVNSALEGTTGLLGKGVADITSTKAQTELKEVINSLDEVDSMLKTAIPILQLVADALPLAADALAYQIPGALAPFVCPSGKKTCTVGDVVDAAELDQLPTTCTTGQATNNLWNSSSSFSQALDTGISKEGATSQTGKALTTLKSLLVTQAAGTIPGNCEAAANAVVAALNGLFGNLGQVGADINDLIPLLKSLQGAIGDVSTGMTGLLADLPSIHTAVDNPCSARSIQDDLSGCGLIQSMNLVANANSAATTVLNDRVVQVVNQIEPAVDKLFGMANLLGSAAKPLEAQINQLPSLIMQIAYGNLGTFVTGGENLTEFAGKLAGVAGELDETYKAIDARFNAGDGFPYGAASGSGVQTAASYNFHVAAAKTGAATLRGTVIFALVMLLLALVGAAWIQFRWRREG